jgi:hypothetical protein
MAYAIGLPCVDVKDARFFTDMQPGHERPLGSPGGAGRLGLIAAHAARVAVLPLQVS